MRPLQGPRRRRGERPDRWLRHLDGQHDMDGKDAWQLAHPVTAISDDGAAVTPASSTRRSPTSRRPACCLHRALPASRHRCGQRRAGPVSRKLGVPGIPGGHRTEDRRARHREGARDRRAHPLPACQYGHLLRRDPQGQGGRCWPITCWRTAPHYLALCDGRPAPNTARSAKMNPPLRIRPADRPGNDCRDRGWHGRPAGHRSCAPHAGGEGTRLPGGARWHHRAGMRVRRVPQGAGRLRVRTSPTSRLVELTSVAPSAPTGRRPKSDVAPDCSTSPPPARPKRTSGPVRTSGAPGERRPRHPKDVRWQLELLPPQKFLSKARNTPFGGWHVTGPSAGDRHQLHAGIQPHSLTADSNRLQPAVSGGTDTWKALRMDRLIEAIEQAYIPSVVGLFVRLRWSRRRSWIRSPTRCGNPSRTSPNCPRHVWPMYFEFNRAIIMWLLTSCPRSSRRSPRSAGDRPGGVPHIHDDLRIRPAAGPVRARRHQARRHRYPRPPHTPVICPESPTATACMTPGTRMPSPSTLISARMASRRSSRQPRRTTSHIFVLVRTSNLFQLRIAGAGACRRREAVRTYSGPGGGLGRRHHRTPRVFARRRGRRRDPSAGGQGA